MNEPDKSKKSAESTQGIILVNKPVGLTSFGVVARLRKLTGVRRIGHCGTLDPFADGLLPVCIGRATNAVQFMDHYDKAYRVCMRFGWATDTMDLTGETIEKHVWQPFELLHHQQSGFKVLADVIDALPGAHEQLPPMFSAVKKDGKRLYEYARAGQTVERQTRPIRVHAAQLDYVECRPSDDFWSATITIQCSKGTYIRVIVDEIGRQLGCLAHAVTLTRISCGPYRLSQALDLDQLLAWREALPDQPAFLNFLIGHQHLQAIDSAFSDYPSLNLSAVDAVRLIQGQTLPADRLVQDVQADARYALYTNGRLFAVGRSRQLTAPPAAVPDQEPTAFQSFEMITERVFVDLADFQVT